MSPEGCSLRRGSQKQLGHLGKGIQLRDQLCKDSEVRVHVGCQEVTKDTVARAGE